MSFSNIISRWKNRESNLHELEDNDRAVNKMEQKKLSANERELNKILEQKRQDMIKNELDKFHKEEREVFWHKDVITQKDLFNNHKKLFTGKNNPSLFTNQENIFAPGKGGMFYGK